MNSVENSETFPKELETTAYSQSKKIKYTTQKFDPDDVSYEDEEYEESKSDKEILDQYNEVHSRKCYS